MNAGCLKRTSNSRTSSIALSHHQPTGTEHEATEAFFSAGGRARTKAQIDQREDCFVLKEGLGAAFLVEPSSGTLAPWGVATVAVTVFNDTPGRYTDKMDITFTGESIPTADACVGAFGVT